MSDTPPLLGWVGHCWLAVDIDIDIDRWCGSHVTLSSLFSLIANSQDGQISHWYWYSYIDRLIIDAIDVYLPFRYWVDTITDIYIDDAAISPDIEYFTPLTWYIILIGQYFHYINIEYLLPIGWLLIDAEY